MVGSAPVTHMLTQVCSLQTSPSESVSVVLNTNPSHCYENHLGVGGRPDGSAASAQSCWLHLSSTSLAQNMSDLAVFSVLASVLSLSQGLPMPLPWGTGERLGQGRVLSWEKRGE